MGSITAGYRGAATPFGTADEGVAFLVEPKRLINGLADPDATGHGKRPSWAHVLALSIEEFAKAPRLC
jgi:hypothetical protein